jgi:GNAT superfamily N-acetyltransferase
MAVAVHATAADLAAVTDVLVDAFAADPVQQWLFAPAADPDAGRRALFEIFVEDYFWLGHAHVVVDGAGIAGAALWAPPDREVLRGDRVQVLLDALRPHLGDDLGPRLGELARTHEHRPAEPHLYLGILGVAPDRQSRGLGADLPWSSTGHCPHSRQILLPWCSSVGCGGGAAWWPRSGVVCVGAAGSGAGSEGARLGGLGSPGISRSKSPGTRSTSTPSWAP